METFDTNTVRIDLNEPDRSVSLRVHRSGHGDRHVLCLHGLGGCGEAFNGLTDVFPAAEWTLLVPDLPGHGATGSMPWYPYTPGWYREVLLAWLLERDRLPELVIGHSMGGTIALLLCEQLTGTPFLLNVEGLPESLDFLKRRVRRYGDLDGEEGLRRVREEFQNVDDPGIRTWLSWTEHCHPDAFFRSARQFVALWEENDLMERYRNHPADRRFYVCGANGQANYVDRQLPEDAYEAIEEAGHFPMVTQRDAFRSLIRRVLEERVDGDG